VSRWAVLNLASEMRRETRITGYHRRLLAVLIDFGLEIFNTCSKELELKVKSR
jgi:hypothetical protein